MRRHAASLILVALIGPTAAWSAGECRKATELYRAMTRASLFCKFAEAPVLKRAIGVMRESCPGAASETLGPEIEAGFMIFERDSAKNGAGKACGG